MFEKFPYRLKGLATIPKRLKRKHLDSSWEYQGWNGGWTEVEDHDQGKDVLKHSCNGYRNKDTGEKVYIYAGPKNKVFVEQKHLDGSTFEEGQFKREQLLGGVVTYKPLEERLSNDG